MPDISQLQAMPIGLSDAEAAARLSAEGPNELARQGHRSVLRIAVDVLREPMFMFLVGAGAIYLLLGERNEALLLSAFAMTSVLITVVQEFRSERVLEALTDLTSPRALALVSPWGDGARTWHGRLQPLCYLTMTLVPS